MPTLHWVGKDKVVNHHHDVPFRLLDKHYTFAAKEGSPANSTANRIIHGDNLEVLKSLLPEFEGKVNCIYIDPPYNTGNEGWVYNDAVNDPKIKKWLGQVVGKEGEDLSRHDKWLCMMYPRLKLLHRLLADDGVVFVSIDDNEQASLKLVMDEIFGANNFIDCVIWQKKHSPQSDSTYMSNMHDYIVVFAKKSKQNKLDPNGFQLRKLLRTDAQNNRYINLDSDERGVWTSDNYTCNKNADERPNLYYPITNPNTDEVIWPKRTSVWRYSQETHLENVRNNQVHWGADGKGRPRFKRFIDEVSGIVPSTLWLRDFSGDNQEARKELRRIFTETEEDFTTPKPTTLLERILQLSTDKNSIILDSFAGSGTTAHAVLKLNAQDGGNRRFILCEMMDYAETITAERVRRVINGYGEGAKAVAGTGGGFDYYSVGAALFHQDKNLNEDVGEAAIRDYVAYTESIPAALQCSTDNPVSRYALGASDTVLWLFYYERERVTTLNLDFLADLNIHALLAKGGKRPESTIIYADKCALDQGFLTQYGITFKRIPRDITRF